MEKQQGATAEQLWQQYTTADEYKQNLGLYETVKTNEAMYIGDQWEGVNAPDLEKPVINVLHRVVTYFISQLVTDDVGASFTPMAGQAGQEEICKILADQVEWVIERCGIKSAHREHLRNCAVDGDGALYVYYDPSIPNGQAVTGEICAELVENTKVLFGNPHIAEVQKQPFVLLVQRLTLEEARKKGRDAGLAETEVENIHPDRDGTRYGERDSAGADLVTVVTRLRKGENGMVLAAKSTRTQLLEEERDTGLRLYPIAWMSWERIRGSYHGQSAITPLIPNQLFINKVWAMMMVQVKRMAFPTVVYDSTKLDRWTNQVGKAIAVNGDPNQIVAAGMRPPDMSAQTFQLVESTIAYTKEMMGASDAALGNVRPDNTSAIIAVQKASAAPLELQRLAFYQWVEDYVRIFVDHIRAYYGQREVMVEGENGEKASMMMDFSTIDYDRLQLRVDIGAAAYWSELMQIQTMDNLFDRRIITDAVDYLESIPDAYISGKNKLLKKLREQQQMAVQMEGGDLHAVPDVSNGFENLEFPL